MTIASQDIFRQKDAASSHGNTEGVLSGVNEQIIFLSFSALAGLILALALGAAGLPLASATPLVKPPKRVKVFRDKFGQQAATLALLLGVAGLAALASAGVVLHYRFPDVTAFWLAWPLPALPLAGCLLGAGVLTSIYRAAWQGMKNRRALHASLGLAASVLAWAFGYLALAFFRHFVLSPTQLTSDMAFFLPPADSCAWLLLPLLFALSLSQAGALVTLYCILRRNKDDFGRDYYTYALKLGAKWALPAAAAAMACQAGLLAKLWPLVRDLPARPLIFWSSATALGALALACILWILVIRNQTPLRLKLHLITAWVLSWVGLSGLCAAYARIFLG